MDRGIDLGPLEGGPHAELIRGLAERAYADPTVEAIWVGGSLAAGGGDRFSDVDFRIAVAPERLEAWTDPDWERYLPQPTVGGSTLRFGERVLLHQRVLSDGTIVDFQVQDTSVAFPEPAVVVLACRNEALGGALANLAAPPAPVARPVDPEAARTLVVDYWITTHKQAKGLGRRYEHARVVGLYVERETLLRAWTMVLAGKQIAGRLTIHALGVMKAELGGRLSAQQLALLGLPSTTPGETVAAIEAIREEMARVGRRLAAAHGFDYPNALEGAVREAWERERTELLRR